VIFSTFWLRRIRDFNRADAEAFQPFSFRFLLQWRNTSQQELLWSVSHNVNPNLPLNVTHHVAPVIVSTTPFAQHITFLLWLRLYNKNFPVTRSHFSVFSDVSSHVTDYLSVTKCNTVGLSPIFRQRLIRRYSLWLVSQQRGFDPIFAGGTVPLHNKNFPVTPSHFLFLASHRTLLITSLCPSPSLTVWPNLSFCLPGVCSLRDQQNTTKPWTASKRPNAVPVVLMQMWLSCNFTCLTVLTHLCDILSLLAEAPTFNVKSCNSHNKERFVNCTAQHWDLWYYTSSISLSISMSVLK
jgi:hypothetical protein